MRSCTAASWATAAGRQKIEKDQAEIFAGVRPRKNHRPRPSLLRIENRDWANWEKILPVEASEDDPGTKKILAPRPATPIWQAAAKNSIITTRATFSSVPPPRNRRPPWPPEPSQNYSSELGTEIASHTVQAVM